MKSQSNLRATYNRMPKVIQTGCRHLKKWTDQMKTQIPLHHYHHLKRLADLRRCSIQEALVYLMDNIPPVDNNWIDSHWGQTTETRGLTIGNHNLADVLDRIQGLPRNIRPVTDGPYLNEFEFFSDQPGLLGIRAQGVSVMDFEMATSRDRAVYELVKDLLPPMTHEQYRVYNTFNSQYLRLVREPTLFTMPTIHAAAIDAGCYVGYKAFALAQFVGGHDVLAFELATENFEVLKLNIANNPSLSIKPIQAALSDQRVQTTIHTRNPKTMAHSLNNFETLKEQNTSLLGDTNQNWENGQVTTEFLDDFTVDYPSFSAVHISVNGHEPEVIGGGTKTIQKAKILRVSCPYQRDGRMVRDLVHEAFNRAGVQVFGKSGGALVAGQELGVQHAIPLVSN